MKKIKWFVIVTALAVMSGCNQPNIGESIPSDVAKEEAAIRATDAQWLAAVKARDVEKASSYWSDDATILPPDSPPIIGKKAIRDYVAGAFASPGFSITWQTEQIVVARSGDMAYQTASDVMTLGAPDGRVKTMKTRAVVVWRKQPDGAWKAAVDIWNAAK